MTVAPPADPDIAEMLLPNGDLSDDVHWLQYTFGDDEVSIDRTMTTSQLESLAAYMRRAQAAKGK